LRAPLYGIHARASVKEHRKEADSGWVTCMECGRKSKKSKRVRIKRKTDEESREYWAMVDRDALNTTQQDIEKFKEPYRPVWIT
jgi:hypothetical protein